MSYLYATEADRRAMLEAIGVDSIQQLIDDQVPKELQMNRPLDIAPGVGELELTRWMRKLAARNQGAESMVCFLGGGAYDHFVPAAVDQIAARGEWYTSYTPYQAEVSQGNLQAMFEYESLVCELTGMDVSNASVYEGATAAVEAALMCLSLDANRRRVVVSEGLHPHTRQALQTYLQWIDGTLVVVPVHNGLTDMASWEKAIDDKTACVLVSQPNYLGSLEPVDRLVAPGDRCCRSYQPWSVEAAWRLGCRSGGGRRSAPWESSGLWWSLSGDSRLSRCVGAKASRKNRRSDGGSARQSMLGADASDPRAAHSAGKSDQQYLHQSRAAGSSGHHLSVTSGPPGASCDCTAMRRKGRVSEVANSFVAESRIGMGSTDMEGVRGERSQGAGGVAFGSAARTRDAWGDSTGRLGFQME
jgi:hypothetical protein